MELVFPCNIVFVGPSYGFILWGTGAAPSAEVDVGTGLRDRIVVDREKIEVSLFIVGSNDVLPGPCGKGGTADRPTDALFRAFGYSFGGDPLHPVDVPDEGETTI